MLRYLRHSLPGNVVGQNKSTPLQGKSEGPRRVIHDPEDDETSPKMTTDLLKLRRCTNQAMHLTNQNPENESRGKGKHRMCIYARLRKELQVAPTFPLIGPMPDSRYPIDIVKCGRCNLQLQRAASCTDISTHRRCPIADIRSSLNAGGATCSSKELQVAPTFPRIGNRKCRGGWGGVGGEGIGYQGVGGPVLDPVLELEFELEFEFPDPADRLENSDEHPDHKRMAKNFGSILSFSCSEPRTLRCAI